MGGLEGVHGGSVSAPLNMHNEWGGFYFYASHLAEMSLTIFGYDPHSVAAFRSGDDVTAVVRYDRYNVTNHFMNGCYSYTCLLYTSMLYEYYGSKEELYKTVLENVYGRLGACETFLTAHTGELDVVEAIRSIIPAYFSFLKANQSYVRMLSLIHI